MSYEGKMLKDFNMPARNEVEEELLVTLFKNNGTIKEFATGEEIVNEIADKFALNINQRTVVLERIYRKENRIVKTPLWHRLLYRAADSLAKNRFVTRPTETIHLTNKKEWMLTEKGYDKILKNLNIPKDQKELLSIKSFEVQTLAKELAKAKRPDHYIPFDIKTKPRRTAQEVSIRKRGFRLAVIEAYDCKCAFCGLKINSPDALKWEVEAAHIVPFGKSGKDDILNGIALCRLHHWAFDTGWLAIKNDYTMCVSSKINSLSPEYGKINQYDFLGVFTNQATKIFLPEVKDIYPHESAISWHREHIFYH